MRMVRYKSLKEFKDDENQVFVFGPHQYSLYHWYKAYENKKISCNSLVVHIDLHSDFLDPRIKLETRVTSEDIKRHIELGQINFDSFMKPALQIGLINEIVFCCSTDLVHNEYGKFVNFESPVTIINLLNRYDKNKKLSSLETALCKKMLKGRIIVDIDLDFFLEFEPCKDSIPTSLIPKNETLIQNEVAAINYLFNYAAITTIATSPEIFCSEEGKRYFEEIKSIFAKYFIIPIHFDDVKAMNCLTNQST